MPWPHAVRASLYIGGVWIRLPKELNMKRLLGLLLVMGMGGCGGDATRWVKMVDKPAPPIALKRLHRAKGTTFKLASHKNKDVVILDFWATWCPPCRKAMPILEKVAKEYEDKGVVLCSINIKEKPNKIRTFLKQQNLNVDVALDTDGKVATKYNVKGIPTMVIVDKKGNIAHVKVGLSGELEEDLHELLDELVTDDEVALK